MLRRFIGQPGTGHRWRWWLLVGVFQRGSLWLWIRLYRSLGCVFQFSTLRFRQTSFISKSVNVLWMKFKVNSIFKCGTMAFRALVIEWFVNSEVCAYRPINWNQIRLMFCVFRIQFFFLIYYIHPSCWISFRRTVMTKSNPILNVVIISTDINLCTHIWFDNDNDAHWVHDRTVDEVNLYQPTNMTRRHNKCKFCWELH